VHIQTGSKREIRVRIGNFDDPKRLDNEKQLAPRPSRSDKLTGVVRQVKVSLIYHAGDLNHCEERKVNKVYS
jgi:hypothetical protein